MKTPELKMLPVSVLKPAAYNPRKKLKPGDAEYEKIKNSIEEFGLILCCIFPVLTFRKVRQKQLVFIRARRLCR